MKQCVFQMVWATWFMLATHLPATQFAPAKVEDLAARAQLILQGTVLNKSCQQDAAGRIYTKVVLQVAEVWKGALTTNRFTVVHGGGILGDRKAVVSGQADYQVGDEVVLFLVLNPRGEGVSVGLAQGQFHIWQDPATGEKLAHNPAPGRSPPLVPASSKARVVPLPQAAVSGLKLADLKQQVTSIRR